MELLVTGGAGFIGSNFIRYLSQFRPTWSVTCLDSITYAGDLSRIQGFTTLKAFYESDVNDVNELDLSGRNFDGVVHFAAESHNDNSIQDPYVFTRTNISGTEALLKFARERGIWFHYISTDEIYGDMNFDSMELFTESSPINPSSPYSASKAAGGLLVHAWARTFGLKVSSSACGNNYGPNQNYEKFIPKSIQRAKSNQLIQLYGSGQNVRDWVHVDNHSSAVLFIIEHGLTGHYNVGINDEMCNLELAHLINIGLRRPKGEIEFIEDRSGHDRRYGLNSDKLRSFGWVPNELRLRERLSELLEFY